ncbi:MAG TPA: protease pro-enzyme activation domain-containing protein [Candidatus Binatia bacterium]
MFTNSIVPLPAQQGFTVQAIRPDEKQNELEFQISLETPNLSDLEQRVAKGEILSETDIEKYRPKSSDYDAIIAWLKDQGFEITRTNGERTNVYARGTVDQIEKSFQVKMAKVTVDGVTYDAARTPPSLPSNISAHVLGISGLQPFVRAHKHIVSLPPKEAELVPKDPNLPPDKAKLAPDEAKLTPDDKTVSPDVANKPPYLVKEVLGAYYAKDLKVTGRGQKIAILIDTVPRDADLLEFWKRNKLSVTLSNVEKINVAGGKLPKPEGEETLDVEWTTGVAPGATVRIYASGSLNFVDLDKALERILEDLPTQPGLHQLSISLGLGESFMSSTEVRTEQEIFLKLASRGVNVFVSSGDAGSNPDESGHSSSGPLQVEYESSDPFVIGVGGTTLKLDSAGNRAREEGWAGGGGGISKFFERPIWQTGSGVVSGKKRLVPDVSLTADPNAGAFYFFQGDVDSTGGTSWSAPVWAGFCALINEARANSSKPPLPFLPPLIYPLIGTKCFQDITEGSNGKYRASPGYDMVTGIGVPNLSELIQKLQ